MAKKNNIKKEENKQEIEVVQEIVEVVEENEQKPKEKKEVSEARLQHLANIRIKALQVKAEKKALRDKAKQLENAELELKAQKYDKTIIESNKLKELPKEEVVEEVQEVVKPKKVKKVIKKIIEQSESEEEEEIEEQIIIKKKSNNNNKSLTNDEKVKLIHQTAEERLKESLKSDRINYLLNQIGAKL